MKCTPLLLLPLIAAVSILAAGCSTGIGTGHGAGVGKPATVESLAALENVDLNCVRLVTQGTAVNLPADAGINLRITGPGKVAGRAAVNRYFGGYTLAAPGEIQWTPFGTTRMAGPADRMTLEDQFLKALEATTRVHATGNGLTLQSADGTTVVELTR